MPRVNAWAPPPGLPLGARAHAASTRASVANISAELRIFKIAPTFVVVLKPPFTSRRAKGGVPVDENAHARHSRFLMKERTMHAFRLSLICTALLASFVFLA